jgi:hypothetical protein
VVEEQDEKLDEITQHVTQVADRVTAPEAVGAEGTSRDEAAGKP